MDVTRRLQELAVLQAEAAKEVAALKEKQRLAQLDLDQAMQTVKTYQQKVKDTSVFDGKDVQAQLQEALNEVSLSDSRNQEQIEAEEANELATKTVNHLVDDEIIPPILPHITINIEPAASLLRSNGHVYVSYVLDGLWQENDELRLQCTSQNQDKNINYYKLNDIAPYESMEYTTMPQLGMTEDGNRYVGSVRLQLPSFGGVFKIIYVRPVRSRIGATISQHVVSESDSFVIPATIRKEASKPGALLKCRTIYDPQRTISRITTYKCQQIAEDLCSIKTILVTLKLDSPDEYVHKYNRISAWAIESSHNVLNLVIEVDVVTKLGLTTVFIETMLAEDPMLDINIDDVNGAQVEIDDSTSRIVCRLPYNRSIDSSMLCSVVSAYTDGTEEVVRQRVAMHCIFCHNSISKMEVNCIKTLPSGVFDNMMHDFICCEDDCNNGIPLTSADIISQPSTMILGNIHLVLHPSNIDSSNILLTCKKTSSVIDLVIGYGGLIATNSNKGNSNVVIDVDTCAVLCRRCHNYIGDGVINPSNSPEDVFLINDIRDVRVGLHNITFHWSATERVIGISVEKCISRLLCHLSSAYGANSFRLGIVDGTEATDGSASIHSTHLLIRILSKDYKFSHLPSCDPKEATPHILLAGIKVSYSLITGAIPTHDTNIFLYQHEYSLIVQALTSRASMFGQGVVKNSKLSCFSI